VILEIKQVAIHVPQLPDSNHSSSVTTPTRSLHAPGPHRNSKERRNPIRKTHNNVVFQETGIRFEL